MSQHTQTRNRNLNESNRQINRQGATNQNNNNLNSANSAPARYKRVRRNNRQNPVNSTPIRNSNKPRRIKGAMGVIGHMAGGAAKFAVTGLGAGVGATVGLAAGIAGGDLDDVISSTVTGTALGGGAAHILSDSASSFVTEKIPDMASDMRDIYEVGAYGEGEAALRAQTREFMSDSDYRQQIALNLQGELGRAPSSSELNNAMRVGSEYYNAGITDIGQINKAMKTEKELKSNLKNELMKQNIPEEQAEMQAAQKAREQSIVITKMANKISDDDFRDMDRRKEIRKNIEKQLLSKVQLESMSEKEQRKTKVQAAQQAVDVMELIREQKGIY